MFKSIYYYIDNFNKDEIDKLDSMISVIYRNYSNKIDMKEIKHLVDFCKSQRRKVYISNNLKLALKFNFDGIYIPSFNKILKYKNIYKSRFEIIGSAHNIKEVLNKEKQGCNKIFLCPIFKTKKNEYSLGVTKFNLIKLNTKKEIIPLGGINGNNIKKINLCGVKSFGAISWVKKTARV